ncbi:MAG: DUF4384 domain-containing protein [Chromatiales bacterium]|nr:DUF4384 domain-containing protein [Chromatiales bacterium]
MKREESDSRRGPRLGLFVLALTVAFSLLACKETEIVHVGPNWNELHQLASTGKSFEIKADVGRTRYKLGEDLSFEVESPRSGRLWILQVDPADEVSLLFPNARSPINTVRAGQRLQIPSPDDSWVIEAAEPRGKSIVAFVVTTGDMDIRDALGGARQEVMHKTLQLVADEPAWAIAKHYIDID